MIKDIKELNFPQYATLETATATIADMGERTISTQVKISGEIVPDFSYDWEVEFKGERYIHPIRKPQGMKENTSMSAKIDMVFQHWAIYEMKRQYFIEMSSTSAGVAVADKYIASLGLNLGDFVVAFNLVLNHYFGDRIAIRLNPNWQYDREAKFVSISYSYIWDVLQQIYEIYGVRWTLKTNAEGVCEILMGYPVEEVSHIFEYGFEGGLLSVQRQVQSTDIRNRILGRGGETNLPLRYFKDKDPNNPLFDADPDWVPELANIAFTELRGKTFRDYVKGWKAKHYGGTVMAKPTEAYLAGYNAEKFDPVEYVEDKESIAKYGVLVGALDNNEDIYPSIQGAPNDVDAIVDAEQVTDDDVDSAVENDSVTTNLESGHQTYRNAPANSTVTIETLTKRYFSVPEGKVGNLNMSLTATGKYSYFGDYEETHPILKSDTVKVTIHDKTTGAEVKSSSVPVVDIPAGDYYYMISADVETNYDRTSMVTLNIESVYLYTSIPNKSEGWSQTFDIWVRNIWGSTRNEGETDKQYADRIWAPILGDRTGGEARVIFASGWLSFSSDWEFPIVGYAYDDSKEGSHWRLTLAKSEAELEASGKYIPYEGYNASAGDRFFFIGIDMPYQYVLWAEERLDDFKRDSLLQTAEINPTWVIKTDKVRLNQDSDGAVLMDFLNAGSQIRLASKQFISGAYETLYVQSLTYNWSADTILYPDVEIVVSDKVYTVKNPVAQIQSNIETIQKQVGSLSNIQQIIRQVCDRLYLRKDGVEDLSKSPTRFLGKVTGDKFRQGQIGGRDWGIYRDENGNAILEADKIVARQGILVSDLVINEAEYVGGLQINSAASMKITAVEETEEGYICYFDQRQGSVTNKFRGDDIALCQKFDVEDNEVKYYKRRVVALTETSVTLSKVEASGTGIPAIDDEIIHYGNYTDKTRQFVIIRDVIGGGYERMLMGLDSVASDGVEYYFAGKSADSEARWFVGGTEQYAEYKNGQLTIKGNIFVAGSNNSINEQIAQLDFIKESFGENAQGLVLGTAIIVGYNDADGKFVPMAGLSGVYDEYKDNGGPAAWYGGTPDNAKSIIFMDGTGYFADGLFKWDKIKGIDLGDGAIKINYDGSVEFGPNIKISTEGDETLGTILTEIAKFNSWFELDEEAKMIKAKYGLYSLGALTAKGKNPSSPGGGGGGSSTLAGLSDVQVGDAQNGQALVYENGYWVPRTVSGGGALTSDAIISALGYTPFDSDAFTKTNIKNALGIKDWALAANKPSYTWTEIGSRPAALSAFTNDLGLGPLAYKSSLVASDIPSLPWSKITSGKPSTLEGYGITGGSVSGALKAGSYDALQYFADGKLIMHRNAGAENFYLNYGGAAEPMYLYGSMYGFHIGASRERVFSIYSNKDANFAASLTVAGVMYSKNLPQGKAFSQDPTSSFITTMFDADAVGDTTYRMRVVKTGGTSFDGICPPYSPMLVVKSTDTHGYISFGYNDYGRTHCYIGGGNADKINWSGILFHDNMDLIPKDDGKFYLGHSDKRWRTLNAVNVSTNGLFGYVPNGGTYQQYRVLYEDDKLYIQAGTQDGLSAVGKLVICGIYTATLENFTVYSQQTLFSGAVQVDGTSRFVSLATFDNGLKIGDATLTWDASAGMLKIDKGVYSIGAITAGGKGQSNKYRLDNWTEWDASDNKWHESSLSAKLGVDLHTRLLAIEESANLGPVKIDLEYILGTPTLTPFQANAAGLTEEVINNLLAGRYTKVTYGDDSHKVWDYTCFGSNGGVNIFFTQGDGFVIQLGIELRRENANSNWIVNFSEI